MKKNKIEYGQCYENDDKVWMVIGKYPSKYNYSLCDRVPAWDIQDTTSKLIYRGIREDILVTWRRPFDNWG